MSRLIIPPDALERQHRSSDPAASVWVSANAGAGKTFVLTQRVVRLLLSGVKPSAILCLTFTNAAAAEMSTRVFKALARFTTMDDDALRAEVAALVPAGDVEAAMVRARALFAEALETPGGLKVATIHAFAASLLRRFPLEAEVPGGFQVLDDPTRDEIEDRAIAETLAEADSDPDGRTATAIAALLPHLSDWSMSETVKAALKHPQVLGDMHARFDEATADALRAELEEALLPPDPGPTALTDALCRAIIAAERDHASGKQIADRLEAALAATGEARETAWRDAFLTGKGEARAFTAKMKKTLEAEPWIGELLAAEQDRLLALRACEVARTAINATVALVELAWPVLARVEDATRRRGLISYDDQIALAARLVETQDAADWVRFKLDEGIDHVMVDEAQDTSPDQWALVAKLVEEFFAGRGAKEGRRTLFVVGDEKQSIYSFQGAAPELFSQKRVHYEEKSAGAGLPFEPVELLHSFRSSPQVLSAVDRVFADATLAASVGAEAGKVRHAAIRGEPGGVDIWPLYQNSESEMPPAWDAPIDSRPDHSGEVKLARAIVDQIHAWREQGPDGGPGVRPGGIYILVRKRGTFAALMNRELKAAGIPAAGSDRLAVTQHIAVKDMLALARALLSPDDLSLAAVLRSPLFDVSEATLFDLAHDREGTLMTAVEAKAPAIAAVLSRWRALALTLRPFDFFAQLLDGEGRRAAFSARMGAEADDALDAFLELALDHEARGVPAMEPFLARMEHVTQELRRSVDETMDAVRVMTVHGAKGLEADVVFLADVGSQFLRTQRGSVVRPLDGPAGPLLVHAPTGGGTPEPIQTMCDAEKDEARREHHRLLYVAMTRARRHLVVCGAYGTKRPARGMWHELVRDALTHDCDEADEGRLSWRNPAAGAQSVPEPAKPQRVPAAPPPWLHAPAPPIWQRPEALAPSAHDAAVPPEPAERRAAGRISAAGFGTLVHALCEREAMAPDAMSAFARRMAPDADEADIARAVEEATGALAVPELGATRVWREVAVVGDVVVPDGSVRRVSGRIDRLQRDGARLTIVDFKTDRRVPATPGEAPEAYLEQLAAYRALMAASDPEATVVTGIVWTATGRYMAMDAALRPVFTLAEPMR